MAWSYEPWESQKDARLLAGSLCRVHLLAAMTGGLHLFALSVRNGKPESTRAASERSLHLDDGIGIDIPGDRRGQQPNRPAPSGQDCDPYGDGNHDLNDLAHRALDQLEDGGVGHPAALTHGLEPPA